MTMPYCVEVGKKLSLSESRAIVRLIDDTFAEIDAIYNKWNSDSEISQLNRLDAYERKRISKPLAQLLKRCDYFVQISNGKFDPTIEPLQMLWKHYLEQNTVPPQDEIERVRAAIGWHNIILDDESFMKKNGKTALDLGSIAKGYTVDLLIEKLNSMGYENVFVEWGGEVRAARHHPQGRSWAVYISNLEDVDPDHALAYVPLQDQAIATSGDYMQSWTVTGYNPQNGPKRTTYFHVFDPQTLQPLEMTNTSIATASALATDCATADALATMLLMCKNLDEAKLLAEKLQKEVPNTSFWLMSRKELKG